jgi:PAS domain S-box-containing protein
MPDVPLTGFSGSFPPKFRKAILDSIRFSHFPIFILDKNGKSIVAYNPFNTIDRQINNTEKALLLQVSSGKKVRGSVSISKSISSSDSVLVGAGYFDSTILPGYKVASIVTTPDIEKVLQMYILDSISKLRFAENEYIFVNTFSGKALVTNGKWNSTPLDIATSGSNVWVNIFKVQQSSSRFPGGVFHTYKWQKLSTSDSSYKTSYFSYIPKWKWIIGTGFYEDDVNEIIDLKKKALYAEMKSSILNILIYLLISWLLCYVFILFFSKRLRINIDLFTLFFEKAADENLSIDKTRINFHEFISIAEGANRMVEKRQQAEHALKESEINYRYLFEQNPAPMLIYDLASLKLLLVNESFIKHYGYTLDEACSLLLTDLYPESERKGITELIANVKGFVYAGEWHHIKKDGTLISIEAFSQGLIFEGLHARIAVIIDISRRKQLEHFLIASKEKAEESDRLKTAFLRNISHEIRTPMNAIIGFSSFLNDPLLPPEKRENFINIITINCNQLLDIITDIVNASTLEAGQEKIFPGDVNINAVLRTLYVQFEDIAIKKNLQFQVRYGLQDYDADIQTDHVKFVEVITNLLNNALKFTKTGSVSFGYALKDNFLEFYVEDTGIGISSDMLHIIFDRFRQAEINDIPEFGGTGLGLSLSKGYVAMLGGEIWVVSQPDKGSTFFFTIPYTKKNQQN